jgi:hypothetical protein
VGSIGSTLPRPKVFVGSPAEERPVAEALKQGLDGFADVTLWCQGVFEAVGAAPHSLLEASRSFDFAAFVMPPEDLKEKRPARPSLRESMLLPFGMFLGALGIQRTIIVCSTSTTIDLPSDLTGVTLATYRPAGRAGIPAAIGCACTIVKERIRRLTPALAAAMIPAKTTEVPEVARRRRRPSLGTASLSNPRRSVRISDISMTGALLETYGEIPENQLLDIGLLLEGGSRVRVTARVVRTQHPQWGRVGGIGIEFLGFEGDSRDILATYIESDPDKTSSD